MSEEGTSGTSLAGQRVVVVGGTSGMGLGAVRAALRAGARVVAASRRPETARESVPSEEGRLEQASLDITDETAVRTFFEHVGSVDHLFVTATPAAGKMSGFLEQDVAAARRFMEGKFFSSWACARYAAPRMRAGGSITFLTGCASIRPRAGITMVTATFAALEAFSQALALELGPIRVNTIRPGVIDSAMWDGLDKDARERLRQRTRETFPARRIGTIDDIGHAAVFLMTNPYVTGAVLEVSGGEPLVQLDI
jgi:NAD(P)-dependent dehydrogenase (short-subunit alcohol dehydrogenase family)